VRKDGTRFWANAVINAMRDAQGGLVGFAKVTRDLTQRRRVEQALAQTNQELERFSYSVSHDLRAPAARHQRLRTGAGRGPRRPARREGKRLLSVIRESAKLGGQLIDALLNFLARGTPGAREGPRRLRTLAESVVAELRQTQGTVAVEVVLAPLLPASGIGRCCDKCGQSDRQRLQVQRQAGAFEGRDRRRSRTVGSGVTM